MNKPTRLRITSSFLKVISVFYENIDQEYIGAKILELTKLKSGTVYPLLGALVETNWLDASWENIDPEIENRPPRRMYRLAEDAKLSAYRVLLEHRKSEDKVDELQPTGI